MAPERQTWRRRVIIACQIGTLLIVLYFVAGAWWETRPLAFDAAIWAHPLTEGHPPMARYRMISDLRERGFVVGKDSAAVVALLGDGRYDRQSPDELRYLLRGDGSSQDDVLVLKLDENRRVVSMEVRCFGSAC